MKIIFFFQYFGTPKGSWSTRVYELTKRWQQQGHEVTVITAPYDKSDIKTSSFISKQKIDGINLIIINSGDSNRVSIFQRVVRAIVFAMCAIWYTFKIKYDVAIASSGPITIGLPMIFAKKIRKKRTVFEVRDLWPAGGIEMGLISKRWQQKLALYFEKVCYQSSDLIITASIGQKQHIQQRFPKLKIEVIPNASDLTLFSTPSHAQLPDWTQRKKLFVHIGSLGLIHNVQYWMKVALAMREIDVKKEILFVFIGDGAERKMLEAIKEKEQVSNVYFLGLKPKIELPLWVQNSVATLFATLDNVVQNTCSPNKIFDSFAAGVPIIQTSSGWIKELVNNENCGINVSINDPTNAAKEIYSLAKNPEEKERLGKNAQRLAKTIFNRDLLAQKYLSLLSA